MEIGNPDDDRVAFYSKPPPGENPEEVDEGKIEKNTLGGASFRVIAKTGTSSGV